MRSMTGSVMMLTGAMLVAAGAKPDGSLSMPHYNVAATLNTARGSLSAAVTITAPGPQSGSDVAFLLGGTYVVTSVEAGPGVEVEVAPADQPFPGLQKISIRRNSATRAGLQLRIRYAGLLAPSGEPPLDLITPELIELNLDSMWIPVRAGLTSRFTVNADIRGVPEGLVVVAPGMVRRSGEHVLIRRERGDLDLAFVATAGLKREAIDGFELYAPGAPSQIPGVYRRHGPAAMKFLEAWFGRMPGRPTRVVMVCRARKSGYARTGYIVITEDDATAEKDSAKFIAHEFAHAWWSSGNPTTEDRCLSESIAEYVAVRYVENAFGAGTRAEILNQKRPLAEKAGPILGKGSVGDPELYNKGPILLFELERKIGRRCMDRLLAHLAKHPPDLSKYYDRQVLYRSQAV